MKNLFPFVLAACLFACGCSKDSSNSNSMKYSISGIADLKLKDAGDTTIALAVGHTGGKQEKLELSISNLPANVTASFEPASGIPSFATYLKYSCNNATPGTYTTKIKATTASGASQTFDSKLTIEHWDCAEAIAGLYVVTSSAGCGGNEPSTVTIEATSSENQVLVKGLHNWFPTLTANVNCAEEKFTIPTHTKDPVTISGTGDFDNLHDVIVNYTVVTPNGPTTCSMHLVK